MSKEDAEEESEDSEGDRFGDIVKATQECVSTVGLWRCCDCTMRRCSNCSRRDGSLGGRSKLACVKEE